LIAIRDAGSFISTPPSRAKELQYNATELRNISRAKAEFLRGDFMRKPGYGRRMWRRSSSGLATLALLAGLFVVVAPAAHAELGAIHPQIAAAHANGLGQPDAVVASSPAVRRPVRHSIPPAQLAPSVVVGSSTRWVPAVAFLAVFGVALLLTPRRGRAPPRFLFA
jgi:hypothetical protein